jgi:hypothetical protein
MSDDKQKSDEKVPPPAALREESSVIVLLESQSGSIIGDISAAAVATDDGDSKQPAAAERATSASTSTTNADEVQESHKESPANSEKESDVLPVSLERSVAISQPGAFSIDGIASASSPYRSITSREASSPSSQPLPPVSRPERTEVLVSAELVEPTQVADVEVGRMSTVVEAKPLEEREDQPLRLIDLWKNRTVRIIAIVIVLIIVGLIVGLVVGLQKSTRPFDNDDQPPARAPNGDQSGSDQSGSSSDGKESDQNDSD